ncbi:hypothetical protein BCR32DRAFT_276386 [Anaeromyces robustus]|uniref:Ankyrin n=1 Tax=Anaeromyces robustus TaxID=1754192 RepID=A0A1Y1XHW7_9FUNG|nr:hypothetical protein BCR32DRAFT_276386 [Anaeromyces robustus]|eukprot:ORX85350.1 hypothetical protein BCR32DRAFT_276386 [Anaeromyces robustus]
MDIGTNEREIELENFQILSKKTDKNLNLEITYDSNNYVPLFFAIQKDNFELEDILIENGAKKGKIMITNAMYEKAIENDNNDLLRVLFEIDSNKDNTFSEKNS